LGLLGFVSRRIFFRLLTISDAKINILVFGDSGRPWVRFVIFNARPTPPPDVKMMAELTSLVDQYAGVAAGGSGGLIAMSKIVAELRPVQVV
jgi:hypothetical protein